MTIEVGDIKTFTLITGMEVLGKVKAVGEGYFAVSDTFGVQVHPRADANGNQVGIQVTLIPLTPFALQESKTGGMDVELYFSSILLSTNPPQQLIEQYAAQTGTIIPPPTKTIKTFK